MWTFQYYNGSAWVDVANAVLHQIIDELNGQLELDFIIPNKSSNMTFVQSNQQVQLLWGSSYGSGSVIFSGLLMAYTATFTQITCTVYNNTFEQMQKRQVTGAWTNVAANASNGPFAAICAAAGMTAGSCPSTAVSIQFNSTDCLTAAASLASLLNTNVYNSGSTVIIGQKGNQTPTSITIDTQSSVNFDRSKTNIQGVIIRGVSPTGQTIVGTAGSTGAGYNTVTLTNNKVTSVGSLNALASAYLESLAETNSGCPLEADIGQTAALNSGDLLTITNGAELGLSMASGAYAIYRITKNLTKSTVEVVTPAGAFLALINETTSINGVISNLANNMNSLQTLSSGSDSNVQQDAYLALTDNANDCVILGLGMQPAPPAATMTPSGSNVVYIIPALTNQAGTTVTFKDPTMSTGVPAVGFGTNVYPFLWTDSIYVYTDYLNILHELYITLYAPISFYHTAIGSVAAGGVKLYDATGSTGSNGQFLIVNSSGLPAWTTYSPAAWNGGTVTNGITAPSFTTEATTNTAISNLLQRNQSGGSFNVNWYNDVPASSTSLQWDNGSSYLMQLTAAGNLNVAGSISAFGNGISLVASSGTLSIVAESLSNSITTLGLNRNQSGGSYNAAWIMYLNASTTRLAWNAGGSDLMYLDTLGDLTLAGTLTTSGQATIGGLLYVGNSAVSLGQSTINSQQVLEIFGAGLRVDGILSSAGGYTNASSSWAVSNVTSSRVLGTTYTNNNAYAIVVCVGIETAPAGSSWAIITNLYVDNSLVDTTTNFLDLDNFVTLKAIVPAGQTYKVTNNWSNNVDYSWIDYWAEYPL